MSSLSRQPLLTSTSAPWALVLIGFTAMYLPVYWRAANGLWQSDDNGHGPIILLVAVWLFWHAREGVLIAPERPLPLIGWSLLVFGFLFYGLGSTLSIPSAEHLSQPLVLAAILLILKGAAALRAAWFAVIFLAFMVPLPATLVDGLTGSLKQWISLAVVDLLYFAGYAISRTGVMISIGQYQLLVADACSGLNSMLSLSALGALFLYVMGRTSRVHNAIMLASILPIALLANFVRVVALVLVTYHLGDEAGQGFLHGAAGVVLVLVALLVLFALDAALKVIRARIRRGRDAKSREMSAQ